MRLDRCTAATGRCKLVRTSNRQLFLVLLVIRSESGPHFAGRVRVRGEVVKVKRIVLLRGEELGRDFFEALRVASNAIIVVERPRRRLRFLTFRSKSRTERWFRNRLFSSSFLTLCP